MSSQTQFQRHSSASSMRTSSVPRTEMGRYISPTYRSSVFSHLTEEKDASFSTRNSYVAQSFSQQAEDLRPALRRANSTYRVSHVMPTVSEWAPNRNHINDPDFHDKIDEEAVVHARKRLEQEKNELKEKKMRHNSEYKEVAKLLEEKHQRRLDHKKPSESDFQKHQESQSEFDSQVSQKWAQMTAERTDFAKMLDQQIEEKVRRRQEEILKEKNDMRNSLDLKPRKEYDMEEYKRILQRQIEEKNQRKMLIEKGKQEEKSERIQDLKNEEATFAHYRQKLAYRKTQSVEFSAGQVRDIAQSEKPFEIVEDFDVKEERGNRRTSMEPYSSKRLSVNTSAYKNQQEEKRKSAQMSNTPLSATRYGSPTKNERAEKKNDWEIASEALLQRKEQQEAYLRDLKEQIMARKKNKDSEVQKDKQEEKKVTGLNMSPYKPKETVLQVAEIVKKQMAHKEDLKNTQVKNKKEETVKTREAHKSNELAMRKQYEEFCQQKMQMLARYKKDLVEESQNKKHKGLKTVKI